MISENKCEYNRRVKEVMEQSYGLQTNFMHWHGSFDGMPICLLLSGFVNFIM
ncbi:hypothetical protein SLEP1_g13265 [Rubroshorea leprosula]|uniref:Uncharacterized protein n=1 Tax=Rubroshorea leprosula TaxID=152421 RepID=A0AAV5IQM8_9ROSI|nr:hypothetical protein SLEP1_g13265 [Rubroshorea leprosula]